MNLYVSGQFTVDRPLPDAIQDMVLDVFSGAPAEFNSAGTIFYIEDVPFDCDVELNQVARLLTECGYRIIPEETAFPYYGDYDGGYLYEDGTFQSYDTEDFVLRTTPTEVLWKELKRREKGTGKF